MNHHYNACCKWDDDDAENTVYKIENAAHEWFVGVAFKILEDCTHSANQESYWLEKREREGVRQEEWVKDRDHLNAKHAKFCHIKSIRQFLHELNIFQIQIIDETVFLFLPLCRTVLCGYVCVRWERTQVKERKMHIFVYTIIYTNMNSFQNNSIVLNRCWKLIYLFCCCCCCHARVHSISPVFFCSFFASLCLCSKR